MSNDWGFQIPIYVTRKRADGCIGAINMGAWLMMIIYLLVVLNVLSWGVLGLYFAAKVVF